MNDTNDTHCGQCRFFVQHSEEGGDCRRFPPTLQTDDEGTVSAFPGTSIDWWCGDFERRVN